MRLFKLTAKRARAIKKAPNLVLSGMLKLIEEDAANGRVFMTYHLSPGVSQEEREALAELENRGFVVTEVAPAIVKISWEA
jgi:hypothetical protein